ncbi:MAG: hemerythrin [Chloroflexota bacterium]|nr:MAG: hemerythrin [Chloroflexota bacterium]
MNTFNNEIDLPEELVPLLMSSLVCEYASIKRDGTPITSPLIPNPGQDGCTIDVNTGLAYPWKAERARRNPNVCLLYSEPEGLVGEYPAVALVYGQATVQDADLQANTDRYVRAVRSSSTLFGKLPVSILGWMNGYIARIWIAITPLKILWWPGGDIDQTARCWQAPEGIWVKPSDPPPAPFRNNYTPLEAVPNDWRAGMDYAFENLSVPVLTIVDAEGFPVPYRTAGGHITPDGVHLDLFPSMPAKAKGRACLTFHSIQIENGEMIANENYAFIGEVHANGTSASFRVERQLPSASFRRSLKGMISLGRMMMLMRKRLVIEATRRGQPVPVVRLVK